MHQPHQLNSHRRGLETGVFVLFVIVIDRLYEFANLPKR